MRMSKEVVKIIGHVLLSGFALYFFIPSIIEVLGEPFFEGASLGTIMENPFWLVAIYVFLKPIFVSLISLVIMIFCLREAILIFREFQKVQSK
jgi:hypothetical protein